MLRLSRVLGLAAAVGMARMGGSQPVIDPKPRLVVLTDIGGDPDDEQSMIRLLLYANELEIEGLLASCCFRYQRPRPELIRERVEAYARVLPNLRRHDPGFPDAGHLSSLIEEGQPRAGKQMPPVIGRGCDTEASEWLIRCVDRDDPRPLWVATWGGSTDLAQALWKVADTRSAAELARFKSRLRVFGIARQDTAYDWIKERHPDLFYIDSQDSFRGMHQEGELSVRDASWLERNVRSGHGPLGPLYPPEASGCRRAYFPGEGKRVRGCKEGDTPSFLHLVPNGLTDPEHPEWGSWGGRYEGGPRYEDAVDAWRGRTNNRVTVARWREAYQAEFEARMDWCVSPPERANHRPRAVVNGDAALQPLRLVAGPGEKVRLDATGSKDQDGDELNFRWWCYPEAGSYHRPAPIEHASQSACTVCLPRDATGTEIHIVLEVVDDGDPALTAYRRIVVQVGKQ